MKNKILVSCIFLISLFLVSGLLLTPKVTFANGITGTHEFSSALVNTEATQKNHNTQNLSKNTIQTVATFEKSNNTLQTTYLLSASPVFAYQNGFYSGNVDDALFYANNSNTLDGINYQTQNSWPPALPDNRTLPSTTSANAPGTSGIGGGSTPLNNFISGSQNSVLHITSNLLHSTGSSWFYIAFIGNILTMLLGSYLRLHSGRSPGFIFE